MIQALSATALTVATQQIAKVGAEKASNNPAAQVATEVVASKTAEMAANPQEVINAAKPVVDKLNSKINNKVDEMLHKKK